MLQDTLDEFLEIQREADLKDPHDDNDDDMGSGWVTFKENMIVCFIVCLHAHIPSISSVISS